MGCTWLGTFPPFHFEEIYKKDLKGEMIHFDIKTKQVGCSTILISTILLILFDNSRMGCFRYRFYYVKKLKLELIEPN
jgi:hypothetical protein